MTTMAQTLSAAIRGDGSWNWTNANLCGKAHVARLIALAYDNSLITSEERDALMEELRYR